jgi:hypothetical protein
LHTEQSGAACDGETAQELAPAESEITFVARCSHGDTSVVDATTDNVNMWGRSRLQLPLQLILKLPVRALLGPSFENIS